MAITANTYSVTRRLCCLFTDDTAIVYSQELGLSTDADADAVPHVPDVGEVGKGSIEDHRVQGRRGIFQKWYRSLTGVLCILGINRPTPP